MEVTGQLHASTALSPGKTLRIEYQAGCAFQYVWTSWRREKCVTPAAIRTQDIQARNGLKI